jgi:hypothetical protein
VCAVCYGIGLRQCTRIKNISEETNHGWIDR